MNYLKITQAGWLGYTGPLGHVEFVDGISTTPVPRNLADRISGIVGMVEADADGNELGSNSVADRLVSEANERAPVIEPLARQTEADKKAEAARAKLDAEVAPVAAFYTGAELLKIADEGGIKAVREKAAPWKVHHRSITVLIKMILDAQDEYLAERNRRIQVGEQDNEAAKAAEAHAAAEAKAKAEAEAARIEAETQLKGGTTTRFSPSYEIGGEVIAIEQIVKQAKLATGITAEIWNQLVQGVRDEAIAAQIEALKFAAANPVKKTDKEPKQEADPQAKLTDEKEPGADLDVLMGSSLLAPTYQINGETVQLGDIVRGAFKKFNSTVEGWNTLPDALREELLADELQRLLPQE